MLATEEDKNSAEVVVSVSLECRVLVSEGEGKNETALTLRMNRGRKDASQEEGNMCTQQGCDV